MSTFSPSAPTPPTARSSLWRRSAILALGLSLPLLSISPGAVQAVAEPLAPAAAALPTASGTAQSLRVASFNVRCANCSLTMRTSSREKKWETRRATVIAQIKGEKVNVIGLQEASPGLLKGTSISQFEDLTNRLGGSYRLTNDKRYGCAKSTSYRNCDKVNNGAAADVRIVYNSKRLSLLDQGSRQLDNEPATSGPRFVAWASFKDRTDGRRFFVANVHTEPGQSKAVRALRVKQAVKIIAEIRAENRDRLPVVMLGDFSATKLTAANQVYDAMMNSGLVIDPLGNSHKAKSARKATARKLINVKYDTLNNFKAKPTSRKNYSLGAHIDYILTSKSIRVLEYKVVLKLKSNAAFAGVIPSDHNMVRATIRLA
ncbi:MAG: hypothetical protein QM695_10020 [Micropruina sp.]